MNTAESITWIVTRHTGAVEWIEQMGFGRCVHVAHLDPASVRPKDRVVGTLPVQLIAEVCGRKAEYYHLVLDLAVEDRGRELTLEDMQRVNARLEQYTAFRVFKTKALA